MRQKDGESTRMGSRGLPGGDRDSAGRTGLKRAGQADTQVQVSPFAKHETFL